MKLRSEDDSWEICAYLQLLIKIGYSLNCATESMLITIVEKIKTWCFWHKKRKNFSKINEF